MAIDLNYDMCDFGLWLRKNNEAKMAGKLGKHKGRAAQIFARGLGFYLNLYTFVWPIP